MQRRLISSLSIAAFGTVLMTSLATSQVSLAAGPPGLSTERRTYYEI